MTIRSILIALSLIIVLGCEKNNNTPSLKCYRCYSVSAGINVQKDICTDRVDTVQLKDQNGNNLSQICEEK